MKVTLIQATQDPILFIANIASICYGRESAKDPTKLVESLYKNGHHSVFEHVWFTFKIEGISRACSHQLVRHRMCSFTQRSQRYCNEGNFDYITPPSAKGNNSYIECVEEAHDIYNSMIKQDMLKEDARYVLPNACSTALYLSCNLRELIHIANERLCKRAQWEIRELVTQMITLVDENLKFMLVPKCKSELLICRGCEEK